MKKILFGMIFIWILFFLAIIYLFKTNIDYLSNNRYQFEINRIHSFIETEINENNIQVIENKINSNLNIFQEINNIKILDGNSNSNNILRENSVMRNPYLILFIKNSNYCVKYQINNSNKFFKIIILIMSLSFIIINLIFCLFIIYIKINILDPLSKISDYPQKLAQGQFNFDLKQQKQGFFKNFLWGLDLLKKTLDEERSKNLSLIKEKQTLIASLSHELKNPLSSIKNYSLAILDGIYKSDEDIKKSIKIILNKSNRIEEISKELLNSSKNNIKDIKVEIKETYTYLLFDNIILYAKEKTNFLTTKLIIKKPKKNLLIFADENKLMDVFNNIIDNAIKYGNNEYLEILGTYEEEFLIINFINSGLHIPKNEIKYIFSSFYRGSNIGNNTGYGLGLFIAKNIMKLHDGDIFIENISKGVKVSILIRIVQ